MASRRGLAELVIAVAVAVWLGRFVPLVPSVAADCECGYATEVDGSVAVFTDLIETDFAHLAGGSDSKHGSGSGGGGIMQNTDWVRQAFNMTSDAARGRYGEMFAVGNVGAEAAVGPDSKTESGTAADGQPAGLALTVQAALVGGMVPGAEIDSRRTDVLYGTFRTGMRLTNESGTCSAFFWYYNDTQEIDMEFLSREYNASNSSYPVNLVLQSRAAAEAGYDASKTPTFAKAYLPFDPTAAFHEYRIDFLPGRVLFYADNQLLARMASADAVPTHAGHLVLQQWSNGNPLWSGGPPAADAVTTVAYVKAYFNSSAPQRQSDWAGRCPASGGGGSSPPPPGAVCVIPEISPSNASAADWFFTRQSNMTNNQTVSSDQKSTAAAAGAGLGPLLAAAVLGTAGWQLVVW